MRKNTFYKKISPLFVILVTLSLLFSLTVVTFAEDSTENSENSLESGETIVISEESNDKSGEAIVSNENNTDKSGESISNIFEKIYNDVENNADKIFSALAFITTLVVGIFYKSGLLPLLKDALSRLKSTVDKAKEAEEMHNKDTNEKIDALGESIEQMEKQITSIELGSRDIEKLCREREAMKTILASQVDMLYAIFICSSLPEYQKEEIGVKIQQMREELGAYEQAE